jgi:hypothetical protein
MIGGMSPALLAMLLLVMLAALVPVRRLSVAGWSGGALFTAWVVYAVGLFVGLRLPGLARFVLPVMLVAFVLPFVAGPERLARLLGGRRTRPVINVTPPPAPGLAEPKEAAPAAPRTTQSPKAGGPGGRPSQRWAPGRPGRSRRPPEEER